ANRSVRLMMELTYKTLQRPESDIIKWTPANVRVKGQGKVLRVVQNKTGTTLEIVLEGELLAMTEAAIGDVPLLTRPIIHTLKGKPYTYSGLDAMLRQAQAKAKKILPTLEP